MCRGLTDLDPNATFHMADCFQMMLLDYFYTQEYIRTARNHQNTTNRTNLPNHRFWHFWGQMSQKPATDQKAGIPKKETTAEMDRKYIHAHSADI